MTDRRTQKLNRLAEWLAGELINANLLESTKSRKTPQKPQVNTQIGEQDGKNAQTASNRLTQGESGISQQKITVRN